MLTTLLNGWRKAKGTQGNPRKYISFELPTYSHFVRCVVGNGRDTYLWED